jgi:hypothetical protein
VHQAVIGLAGRIGEVRGRRGSEPDWVKYLSEERRRAIHEPSHAIVAALRRLLHRVTIIPNEERRSRSGRYYAPRTRLTANRYLQTPAHRIQPFRVR